MKSRYAGKDCSTEKEKCPSDFLKIFVWVGEKQRICGWPTELKLKWISSFLIPNLEAAGHYHLVHWWGVWDIIFTDLPRFRWKPRCFCHVLVQFWYFSSGFGLSLTFGCRLSCFLFVSFAPIVFVFRCLVFFMRVLPKSTWSLTFYNVQKQPARSDAFFGTVYILWSFGFVCFDICRFESPFWMPRCYPKIPISGTPSAWLHLPISHTCHPVYGAHEDEVLGGYHWLCLRVWLRHRDSYFDALPLLPPARSATFQPNDHRSCCLWRWSQSVLTWSQRLYHGENLATGQGCSCLSDCCCCIWLVHWTCAMVGWRNKS